MKIRKLIASVLTLTILAMTGILSAFAADAADTELPTLSMPTITAMPGDIVEIPVKISGLSNVDDAFYLLFHVDFDPQLVMMTQSPSSEYIITKDGDSWFEHLEIHHNKEGHLFNLSTYSEEPLKDGTIVNFYFMVKEKTPVGTYNLDFSNVYLSKGFNQDYPINIKNGRINVVSERDHSVPRFVGDRVSAEPGDTVEYTVQLQNNPGHFGFGAMLQYSPGLQLEKTSSGYPVFYEGVASGVDIVDADANYDANLFSISGAISGNTRCTQSGDLFTVKFTLPPDAEPGYYPVLIDGGLIESASKLITTKNVHGWIRVKGDEPDVVLSADKTEAAPGETVLFSVYTDENPGYEQVSAVVSFDPSFTVRKESGMPNGAYTISGPAALTTSNIASLNQTKGTVSFADAGKLKTATGKLFSFYITIPEDAEEGEYPVAITQCSSKADGKTLITAGTSGYIKVVRNNMGDANCDSRVDLNDAVAILQFSALPAKYPLTAQGALNADVVDNGTSGVTGTDALAIQMCDAGLLSPDDLPVTGEQLTAAQK